MASKIKVIDRNYIKDLAERAQVDINNANFDSAITKCRTLVEEIFCYVIELKNEKPSESGNINDLYKQVKILYNMHHSSDIDVRVNTLLSGLEKIRSAIAEMRNKNSDSHGVGVKRINIEKHHRHELAIDGISYIKLDGEYYYAQEIFDVDELTGNLDKNAVPVEHSVYDHIKYDSSTVEKPFALELDKDPRVKIFFKIPEDFKIDTPIGTYNPDWAVYLEEDGDKKCILWWKQREVHLNMI